MRIRIHRGAREVGGNCVEVVANDGTRIALDVGLPLEAVRSEVTGPVFDGPLDAIFVSHPHLDHYGLVDSVTPAAPVFVGAEADRLLRAAAFFSPVTRPVQAAGHLHDRVPVTVGSITVTPYLVDHSGFDSYSLLVESDGKRVFYTGDFRGHGRKARLFEDLLAQPPLQIDILITEGTQLGGVDHGARHEHDLEDELVDVCRSTQGLVLVIGSAQNLDRVVTAFRGARRSGRTFVTDLYTATVAAATRPSIPQPGFDGYRVYVPQRQRVLVKQSQEFERVRALTNVRIFGEELLASVGATVAYLPSSAVAELLASGALDRFGTALWSMWDGYLTEPSGVTLTTRLRAASVPFRSLHTSGHASVADLGRLIRALAPGAVVPIHTDAPERFSDVFADVTPHADGEWWAA